MLSYQQLRDGELRLCVKSWGRKYSHRLSCIYIDGWTDYLQRKDSFINSCSYVMGQIS